MSADQDSILADISEMLHAILEDDDETDQITMDTTFHEDLEMESIDLVALAGRLQARYGNTVNFAQFIAGLSLDAIIDLKVGDLVEYIQKSLAGAEVVSQ
jgi:acyl carrier protein